MKRYLLIVAGVLVLFSLLAVPSMAAAGTGKIAFAESADGNPDVWTMNPDGSGQVRLTDNTVPVTDLRPSWSPDGSRIAFSSDGQICVMNADGTGKVRLTDGAGQMDWPAWSPDGSRIAFMSDETGSFRVRILHTDGTGQTELNPPGLTDALYPSWSPDGSRITFSSFVDEHYDVFAMNADGTDPVRLTYSSQYDDATRSAWSPDGSRIAYIGQRSGSHDLYATNVDGSEEARLTFDGCAGKPSWSPDGSRIAFSSYRVDPAYPYPEYPLEHIDVVNADGTGRARLTFATSAFDPSWGVEYTAPAPPAASFETNVTTGEAPLAVRFTDTSSSEPTSWSWTFGDRTTSRLQHPVHTYRSPGDYRVSLRVKGPQGWSERLTKTVTVRASSRPMEAAFDAAPVKGFSPLTVAFTDRSSGDPIAWRWDFGDGTSSTRPNPVKMYRWAGTYSVRLTVTDASGETATVERAGLVTVLPRSKG